MVLNEFESPQAAVFEGDPEWTLYRAAANNTFRNGNYNGNAIAWKTEDWRLVGETEFLVPYKTTLHMPVVTLENRDTGALIRVIGVHNPASTAKAGNQQGARNTARAIEIAGMQELREQDPEIPILIAGDMNERETVFCSFTGTGFLQSSAGGSRRWRLPVPAARPGRLDLLHARPGLPGPGHRPVLPRPDQRPPARPGGRGLPGAPGAGRRRAAGRPEPEAGCEALSPWLVWRPRAYQPGLRVKDRFAPASRRLRRP